jgi:hypothetical protein
MSSKVKPTRKRPTPAKDTTANQAKRAPARRKESADRRRGRRSPELLRHVWQIVDHINTRYKDCLHLVPDGQVIRVELRAMDAGMIIAATRPLRAQLTSELRRVAAFCHYLAQITEDDDWSDEEIRDAEIFECWQSIGGAA